MSVIKRLKKGDEVLVISGKDKGKVGTIRSFDRAKDRIVVAGVNLVKKHQKQTRESSAGIVEKEASIHVSNVAYYDKSTKSHSKIALQRVDGKLKRIIKKTKQQVDE
jgi:large subunit ribosomal protein L24